MKERNEQSYQSLQKEELLHTLQRKDDEIERLTRLVKGQEKELATLETSFALRVGRKIDDLTMFRHTIRRGLQNRRRQKRTQELAKIRKQRTKMREKEKRKRVKLREKQKQNQLRNRKRLQKQRELQKQRQLQNQKRIQRQRQLQKQKQLKLKTKQTKQRKRLDHPTFFQKVYNKWMTWRLSVQKNCTIPILPKKEYNLSGLDFSQLKVATILDEFSYNCFKYEMDLHPLSIHDTIQNLESIQPQLLFVESAWKGSSGQWKIGLASNYNKMVQLTNYCKEHDIPTIFWCKEDPVHFEHFLPLAQMFDYVFTTDENMVPHYKRECGHEDCYVLPFAAQPQIHNPIQTIPRENRVCFAGSYYRNKYQERSALLCEMLRASQSVGVDIYDRNFESGIEHYRFPEEFEENVKGVLPYDKIEVAYKGYRVNLNVNTVTNSPTMFSRRVFESLACHTPVLSNYAIGVEQMFGDLIDMSESKCHYEETLKKLFHDELTYQKTAFLGLKEVLSKHTYRHRVIKMLEPLCIHVPSKEEQLKIGIVVSVSCCEEVRKVIEQLKLLKGEYYSVLFVVLNDAQELTRETLNLLIQSGFEKEEIDHFFSIDENQLDTFENELHHPFFTAVDEVVGLNIQAYEYNQDYLVSLKQSRLYELFSPIMKGDNLTENQTHFEMKQKEYQFHMLEMDLNRGMLSEKDLTLEGLKKTLHHQTLSLNDKEKKILIIDSFGLCKKK